MAKTTKKMKVMTMPDRGDALEPKSGFSKKHAYKTKFGKHSAKKKV
jgi:hypothetical protein